MVRRRLRLRLEDHRLSRDAQPCSGVGVDLRFAHARRSAAAEDDDRRKAVRIESRSRADPLPSLRQRQVVAVRAAAKHDNGVRTHRRLSDVEPLIDADGPARSELEDTRECQHARNAQHAPEKPDHATWFHRGHHRRRHGASVTCRQRSRSPISSPPSVSAFGGVSITPFGPADNTRPDPARRVRPR